MSILDIKNNTISSKYGEFFLNNNEKQCLTHDDIATDIYIPYKIKSGDESWYFVLNEDVNFLQATMPYSEEYTPVTRVGNVINVSPNHKITELCFAPKPYNLYYNIYNTGVYVYCLKHNLNAIKFCEEQGIMPLIEYKHLVLANYFVTEIKKWTNTIFFNDKYFYYNAQTGLYNSYNNIQELIAGDNNLALLSELILANAPDKSDAKVTRDLDVLTVKIRQLFKPCDINDIDKFGPIGHVKMKNAVLKLENIDKKDHVVKEVPQTKDLCFLNQYDYDYKPDSVLDIQQTMFYDYIKTCYFYNDIIPCKDIEKIVKLLLQIIGGAILNDSVKYIYSFYGGGGDGKSYLMRFIAWILSDFKYNNSGKISAVIDFSKASNAHIYEHIPFKCLITGSEICNNTSMQLKNLKEYTGGQSVEVNGKYKTSFEYMPRGSFILQLNSPDPNVYNYQGSVRRRLVHIFFANEPRCYKEQIDYKKVFLKKDKEDLVNEAIKCYLQFKNEDNEPQIPDFMEEHKNLLKDLVICNKADNLYEISQIYFDTGQYAPGGIGRDNYKTMLSILGIMGYKFTNGLIQTFKDKQSIKLKNPILHELVKNKIKKL